MVMILCLICLEDPCYTEFQFELLFVPTPYSLFASKGFREKTKDATGPKLAVTDRCLKLIQRHTYDVVSGPRFYTRKLTVSVN